MTEVVTPSTTLARASGLVFRPIWAIYLLLGVVVLGATAFAVFRPVLVLPRITLAPGFALVDQNGKPLTNEDMRGKIVLYNISHAACTAPCPQTAAAMQAVQARLDEVETFGIPVELVTISVDPERDTPEVLRAYAASLDAGDNWHFVTGAPDRLKYVVGGGFGVYYTERADGTLAVDPGMMLVDGQGILRAEYRTAAPEVDRLLRDIGLVAEEAENSGGASRYAYEAAHLFLCYPR